MSKCPLKNFEECDKDCAWYYDGIKSKSCAVKLIANTDSLSYLDSVHKNLYSILTVLKEANPSE